MPEQQGSMKQRRIARKRIREEKELRETAWRLGCSPELLRAWLRSREANGTQGLSRRP